MRKRFFFFLLLSVVLSGAAHTLEFGWNLGEAAAYFDTAGNKLSGRMGLLRFNWFTERGFVFGFEMFEMHDLADHEILRYSILPVEGEYRFRLFYRWLFLSFYARASLQLRQKGAPFVFMQADSSGFYGTLGSRLLISPVKKFRYIPQAALFVEYNIHSEAGIKHTAKIGAAAVISGAEITRQLQGWKHPWD
jgi:hypothetical protein